MALVPSSIGATLATQSGFDQFFTNVKEVAQTVSSVYDQITGKSETVSPQTQAAAVTAASAPEARPMSTLAIVGIGLAVVIGLALVLRK
jgi:hypothetical protein